MKKFNLLLTGLAIILTSGSLSAQTKSCCSANSTGEFAMLGSDAKFQSAHLAPEPINFIAAKGTDITFPVTGGKDGKAFLIKSNMYSDKYIFIFHEWWGLNDHIKQEAERYSNDFPDVNILAIDLYDGQIATTAEEAGKMMQAVSKERAESIIKGALTFAGPKSSVQTIGWCFGGGWSLQASLLAGKQAKGCVMYYGMPEKDSKILSTLNAPVLGIFATYDDWITKPIVDEFENQMKTLKKPVTITWFDAVHAFANPSNPKFNEVAAAQARDMAVGFLRGNFSK